MLLATVLSLGVLVLWQFLVPKPPKAPPPKPAETSQPAAPAPQGPQATAPAQPAPATPAPPPNAPEETVVLDGNGFVATLTSHGGAVKHLVLRGDKFRREVKREGRKETVQIDLVRVSPEQPYPLSIVASPELGGTQDLAADPAARASMRLVSKDAQSAVFEGRAGNLGVKKTYRVTGRPFELTLDVELTGAQAPGGAFLLYPGFMPPETKSGGFFSGPPLDFVRPVCRAGDDVERFDVAGDGKAEPPPGTVAWAGIDQHYFISAVLPKEPLGACSFQRGPVKGAGLAAVRIPIEGAERRLSLTVYAGPKDVDTLRAYGRKFETAIDYGAVARPFAFFSRILLYVMRWLENVVKNWGVAIILLTLIVKVLLYPLTAKSMHSMAEMRKLQPEIEKLKAKFGSDREKLQMATMQLYQQHKVNPLGGCLPTLIQLPIWFALYATLQTSVELYREPFLWMTDLTQHDPFFILPIATGLSSFVTQKMSPQVGDPAQAKMMLYFMPALFTFMMILVPGGLTLYIFVNNVISIAQQQFMMRRLQPAPAAAAK